MNLDVYTVGGIEILSQVYKGIVMIFGDADFDGMLKLFAALGTVSAVIALAQSSRFQNFVKYFTFSFFIFTACFGARTNVTIIDTKFQQTYVVNSVPFLPAYATSIFSTASYYITKLFQNVFHTGTVTVWNAGGPADNAIASVELDYERTGYGGFFDLLTLLRQMEFYKIANPDVQDFNSRLDAFLYQCTMPEISVLTQAQTEQRIKQAPDLWAAIRPQVNQFMDYGGLTTCVDFFENGSNGVYDLWNIKIKPMFEETGDTKILAFFGIQPSAILPFKNAITEAVQGGAVSLGDSIGQAGLIAALDKAYLRFVSDSPSAMQYLALVYQTGRNVEEAKQMGRSLGLYAKEVVPYLKTAFEAICIVILPIVALLIFLPGYTFSSMKNYIFMSGTVYLWDPILAAVNGLVNISYIAKLHTALQAANAQGVLNIVSYNTIAATMDFFPSVAGYLGLMAPGLAYGLVRGGMEVMFSTMANMMAGPVTSVAPHQETASSIETQKIANQTGKSFGQVEMQYNAAGQAKLNAMVFQSGVNKHGYDKLFGAESGAFDYGVGQKSGLGDAVNTFGESKIRGATAVGIGETVGKGAGYGFDPNRAADVTRKGTEMGAGDTEGRYSTWNKEKAFDAAAIKQSWDQDYQSPATLKTMAAMSSGQYANAYATGQIKQYAGYENIINKAKAAGLDVSTPEAEHKAIQEMARIQEAGGLMSGKMANTILGRNVFNDNDKVLANWQADEKGTGYFVGVIQDGNKGVELRDGRLIEKGVIDDQKELDALKAEALASGNKNWAQKAKIGMGYEKTTSLETGQLVDLKASKQAEVVSTDKSVDDRSTLKTTKTTIESGTSKVDYNINRKEGTFQVVNPDSGKLETVSGTIDMTQEGKMVKMTYGQGEKGQFVSREGGVTEGYIIRAGNHSYMVSGIKDSMFVEKGMIRDSEGFMHAGTIFRDGKTGQQLFVEGKSGKMYTTTLGEESWTFHRQLDTKGNALSSTITKYFGLGAGVTVEQTKGHFEEGIDLVAKGRGVIPKQSTQTTTTTKSPLPESKPILLDQYGRPIN